MYHIAQYPCRSKVQFGAHKCTYLLNAQMKHVGRLVCNEWYDQYRGLLLFMNGFAVARYDPVRSQVVPYGLWSSMRARWSRSRWSGMELSSPL